MTPKAEINFDSLRKEQAALHARKSDLSVAFGRGSIDLAQLEAGTADINKRLGEIQRTLIDAVGESPLTPFVLNPEKAPETWAGLSLGRKREVVRLIMSVTLGQAPRRNRGRRPAEATAEVLDTSTVTVTFKRPAGAQEGAQAAA